MKIKQNSYLRMQSVLKKAYNVELSVQEAATITSNLVALVKLLEGLDEEAQQRGCLC